MTLSSDKQALKRAICALIAEVGGQEAAAEYSRVSRPRIAQYGNPNEESYFVPVDVVADLEAVTHGRPGHPHVTRALARRQGYDLVPLPEAAPDEIDPHHHLSALARETGDVMAKLALALADGRLTAHEVRVLKLISEVEEALQAIVDLRAGLKRLVDST